MSSAPPAASASRRPVSRRIRRERRTVEVMIRMYCADKHLAAVEGHGAGDAPAELCADCTALLSYALGRVGSCPFGEDKPTCARCTRHCFRAQERAHIREIMRYSGPRMTSRYPYLALRHLLDRRRTPETA